VTVCVLTGLEGLLAWATLHWDNPADSDFHPVQDSDPGFLNSAPAYEVY